MKVDAATLARRYEDARDPGRRVPDPVDFALDRDLCVSIADWYDGAPDSWDHPESRRQYDVLKAETLRQFEAMTRAGVRVRPWLGEGQPYRDSAELRRDVADSGVLFVYLTSDGHGTGGSTPDAVSHPMVEPTDHVVDGVRFAHNDVFRAVHDFFGHVARGNPFTARGEHLAAWDHSRMYPEDCHPALLTETLGQICWFYYGPHLRDSDGRVPLPGAPGYTPPSGRPYSPQKTVPLPTEFVSAFFSLFP
ncbi:crotonobetainyl-CoA--carnitine CoA-transferase [Streptomyces sp. BI20]|uniref:crotonobetainyl-CoA--carnitine CoA-transferase n=1 Tax=Streptomyces sp. BI20 TaxID=3403460 RepID=UPI003C76C37F